MLSDMPVTEDTPLTKATTIPFEEESHKLDEDALGESLTLKTFRYLLYSAMFIALPSIVIFTPIHLTYYETMACMYGTVQLLFCVLLIYYVFDSPFLRDISAHQRHIEGISERLWFATKVKENRTIPLQSISHFAGIRGSSFERSFTRIALIAFGFLVSVCVLKLLDLDPENDMKDILSIVIMLAATIVVLSVNDIAKYEYGVFGTKLHSFLALTGALLTELSFLIQNDFTLFRVVWVISVTVCGVIVVIVMTKGPQQSNEKDIVHKWSKIYLFGELFAFELLQITIILFILSMETMGHKISL